MQNADGIAALESWRVAEPLATHLAADVADRRHAARVEPVRSLRSVRLGPIPWRSSAEVVITTSAPTSRYLTASSAPATPVAAARAPRTCPASTPIHNNGGQISAGVLKIKVAAEPHREKINVGLVDPIEQHEVARSRLVKAPHQVEDKLEAPEECRVSSSVANWIDDDRTYRVSGTGT